MPGRDELILQNQANANRPSTGTTGTTPAAQQTQEQAQPEAPQAPVSSYRSIMGANLDLLATLDAIKFEPKVNDGGMYNAVAWIEFWTRSQTGESAVPFADIGSFVDYSKLNLDLKGLGFDNLNDWSKTTGFTLPGANSELTKEEIAIFTDPNLANLSFIKDYKVASGQAKSANPNGGGFNGFVKRFLGLSSTEQTEYNGKLSDTDRSSGTVEGATAPFDPLKSFTFDPTFSSQPKWQFLFNPEEIDWEGGPEYAETDAWGVMDPANAGRPLFWKNMRNQRLTFSKVLLNGFVFGKRVDSLEKGLKDLFMSTQGSNSDGPPVLNFVWGERKFGPCVLKDLRIKEKNWENGMLVNAEVSFVLEKIPEWIINDGFVDVARPGKQPILGGDVLAPPAGQNTPEVQAPPPPPAPPSGTGSSSSGGGANQQTSTTSLAQNLKTCTYLEKAKVYSNDSLFDLRKLSREMDQLFGFNRTSTERRVYSGKINDKAKEISNYYTSFFLEVYTPIKSVNNPLHELFNLLGTQCNPGTAIFKVPIVDKDTINSIDVRDRYRKFTGQVTKCAKIVDDYYDKKWGPGGLRCEAIRKGQ